MEFINVDGVRIATNVSGPADATPLVLLHGAGLDRSTWDEISPAFVATHRVYAIDLRGFGDSDRPGRYGYEPMRDDVLGLLDVIGAKRVDLIGHSMGGAVAWLAAQEQPERIRRLVVEDLPPPTRRIPGRELPERPNEELPFDWEALMAIYRQSNDPDPRWWDEISAVTAPTLLLSGGAPSHVPVEVLAEAAALLPDGRIEEIPVGHHIHRDAAAQFLAATVPFLTR